MSWAHPLAWTLATSACVGVVSAPQGQTALTGTPPASRQLAPSSDHAYRSGPGSATRTTLGPALSRVEERLAEVEAEAHAMDEFVATEMEPVLHFLNRIGGDPEHSRRITAALFREGRRNGLDPRLLLAVMMVENPWLDVDIRSPVGAVGLMQVMPFHAGHWGCDGRDLEDLDVNICHGARILAHALERTGGDLDAALLRYNGCVHGTNTPDCHQYPRWVLDNPELSYLGL